VIAAIANVLVQILNVFHGWIGSYGLAIILLTLVIRLTLHPLTRWLCCVRNIATTRGR